MQHSDLSQFDLLMLIARFGPLTDASRRLLKTPSPAGV
jgi:hypothetical protein